MKKLFAEFKTFINKGNALSLAIGVIIGASFTAIVTAINQKIISPLIGLLLGDNDLSESLITVLKTTTDPETGEIVVTNAIYWGAFIQAVIDFLLTAVILFTIFKVISTVTNSLKKITLETFDNFISKNPSYFESKIKEIITIDGMRIVFEQGGFAITNDFDSTDYALDVLEMSINKYSSLS